MQNSYRDRYREWRLKRLCVIFIIELFYTLKGHIVLLVYKLLLIFRWGTHLYMPLGGGGGGGGGLIEKKKPKKKKKNSPKWKITIASVMHYISETV